MVAGKRLNADRAIVDGEIVAVDQMGKPSFQALQHRSSHPKYIIAFVAFDLPWLEGQDMIATAIEERRAVPEELIRDPGVLFSQNLPSVAADIVRVVREHRLEGVVAKRRVLIHTSARVVPSFIINVSGLLIRAENGVTLERTERRGNDSSSKRKS